MQAQSRLSGDASGQKRVAWVDIAKGICIILVVMMHATLGVQNQMNSEGFMDIIVSFAKPFRMPDFFLISGLFLAAAINRPWRLYADRKIVHFVYFYVLWFILQFGLKAPISVSELGLLGAGKAAAIDFVNPHSTLWFIYMLPIFFVVTWLLRSFSNWLIFAGAVILQILPIHVGIVALDKLAAYYVYFFAGYAFAPFIFKIADWARENRGRSLQLLLSWALINAAFVFIPLSTWLALIFGTPAELPIVALILGFAGAVAITTLAAILDQSTNWFTKFMRHAGANSIAIYLAFFFPMGVTRMMLIKFFPFLGAGWISLITLIMAVVSPLILLWIIHRINFGHFLFRRPIWAITAWKNGEQEERLAKGLKAGIATQD